MLIKNEELSFQPHPNYNKQITEILESKKNYFLPKSYILDVRIIERNRGNFAKARAYEIAINTLKYHDKKIENVNIFYHLFILFLLGRRSSKIRRFIKFNLINKKKIK